MGRGEERKGTGKGESDCELEMMRGEGKEVCASRARKQSCLNSVMSSEATRRKIAGDEGGGPSAPKRASEQEWPSGTAAKAAQRGIQTVSTVRYGVVWCGVVVIVRGRVGFDAMRGWSYGYVEHSRMSDCRTFLLFFYFMFF